LLLGRLIQMAQGCSSHTEASFQEL
jgi:hypothetical protein